MLFFFGISSLVNTQPNGSSPAGNASSCEWKKASLEQDLFDIVSVS